CQNIFTKISWIFSNNLDPFLPHNLSNLKQNYKVIESEDLDFSIAFFGDEKARSLLDLIWLLWHSPTLRILLSFYSLKLVLSQSFWNPNILIHFHSDPKKNRHYSLLSAGTYSSRNSSATMR